MVWSWLSSIATHHKRPCIESEEDYTARITTSVCRLSFNRTWSQYANTALRSWRAFLFVLNFFLLHNTPVSEEGKDRPAKGHRLQAGGFWHWGTVSHSLKCMKNELSKVEKAALQIYCSQVSRSQLFALEPKDRHALMTMSFEEAYKFFDESKKFQRIY